VAYFRSGMNDLERKAFLILALLLLATAWTSYGYYELDEHFQIIEFAGSKLGIVPTQNLPWEYKAGIRPWLQPVIFIGLCKLLALLGIENRFIWTFIFRSCCAVCGFFALLCIYRLGAGWLPDARARRRHLWLCTTLGFLPFLFVRTSSESLSASFFAIGLYFLLKDIAPSNPAASTIPARLWVLSGLMFGLAFEFRYQTIIMVGGLTLWLAVFAGARWKSLFLASPGFALVLSIGFLADRYGYGKWTFPFNNYFRVNLIEGKTADFGTDPFFAYLYLVLENFFAPIVLIFLIALFVFWVRKPKHALVWITLPFFIFHCFIGHKEERFLIPMLFPVILIPHLIFLKDGAIVLPGFLKKRFWATAYKWLWRYNWLLLILLCIYPFGVEPYIKHQKYIFEHQGSANIYYSVNFNPYCRNELIYSFYRPSNLKVIEVGNLAEMASIAEKNPASEIYFFSIMPYLENWPEDLNQRTSLVNPGYFVFRYPWVVKTCAPLLKSLNKRYAEVQVPALFKISPRDRKIL
jgi:GPI mannosyltransferase 3